MAVNNTKGSENDSKERDSVTKGNGDMTVLNSQDCKPHTGGKVDPLQFQPKNASALNSRNEV